MENWSTSSLAPYSSTGICMSNHLSYLGCNLPVFLSCKKIQTNVLVFHFCYIFNLIYVNSVWMHLCGVFVRVRVERQNNREGECMRKEEKGETVIHKSSSVRILRIFQ